MRITFLLPPVSDVPSGGYKVAFDYANRLSARGHDCTLLFLSTGRGDDLRRALRRPRRLWEPPRIRWFDLSPRITLRSLASLRTADLADADTVVATAWHTAERWGEVRPADQRGIYLLQGFETWSGNEQRVRATLRLPMTVVAVSSWLAGMARQEGNTDVHWVPNGVDPTVYRPDGRVLVGERPKRILAMWHPDAVKGGAVALDAVRRATRLDPEIRFTCFSAYRPPRSLPADTTFVHRPDPARLAGLYRDAAVFVTASFSEGWNLPAAEAMACGCALAGTAIPGMADFAVDSETALLVPPGDADALAGAIVRLNADGVLRHRLAAAGAARMAVFTPDAAGKAFEALVSQIGSGVEVAGR